MSNPNNAFGFRPLMATISGAPARVAQYGKPATDSHAIYMFDLVGKVAASVPDPTGLGNPMAAIQTGYQLTPGTSIWLGVSLNYGAASVATPHYVIDSVDAIFMAQVDGTLAVTTASHMGKNANVAQGTAGNVTTKQSGLQIANGSIATTSTLDLRLLKISNLSPNAEGANAIVEVLINKHFYGQGVAGV